MAIHKTEAIVLRRWNIKETSLLATLYTRDFGKINGIAKGIKRPKARFTSSLELFSLNDIVFYESRKGNLDIIAQCDLKDLFDQIRKDLKKYSSALYFVELVDRMSEPYDKREEVFGLLLDSLRALRGEGKVDSIVRIFEVKLLDLSGFMPRLDSCVHCRNKFIRNGVAKFSLLLGGNLCQECFEKDKYAKPITRGAIASIDHIQRTDWSAISKFRMLPIVALELKALLSKWLALHLDKPLKSLNYSEKILSEVESSE